MSIRAVCFDFQDTLAYYPDGDGYALYLRVASEQGIALSRPSFTQPVDDAWEAWRTPLGIDHSRASRDERAFRAVRAAVHTQRFVDVGVDPALAETLGQRVVDLEAEPDHYRLFDDTKPSLDRLARARVQSLIVSNHIWRLPEVVRALGIASRLEGVLTSARVGYRKPHPEIYAAALRLLGCEASEVLFVGDSVEHDVDGPRRQGMQALLLDRDGTAGRDDAIRSLLDVPLP